MEPRIQYATTADGVSIAFWTLGEGMPFVQMPSVPWSHIQLEWQDPEVRRWYERLAQKRKLVRYDGRGTGLSERYVTDYSFDALVLDLETVVDHLSLDRFALWGLHHSGPVAVAYAARHPDRVSHLVLWCAWTRGSDYWPSSTVEAFRAFIEEDWELYIEALAQAVQRGPERDQARRYAAYLKECVTPEAAQAAFDAIREFDVTALLPQVRSPTLVLHRRQLPWPEVSIARGLASRIPDARLALLEGASSAFYLEDAEAVTQAIDEFLGEGEEAAAPPAGPVAILFTDMESSTTLTQRLGDAQAQELLRSHNRIVRNALKAHGGTEIKHTGDGIMASLPSASRALQCAVAIQRALAKHDQGHPDTPLRVRIGLNAGEPVAEDEDLFGTAVQLAARICARAEPGQILASNVVRELAAGKGFLFADRGEMTLRGFEDPVRLFEVRWREAG